MDIALLAASIEASAFGAWMRAGWSYPIANVLHLVGMTLLIGPIDLLDLRVLGFARDFPLERVTHVLTPFVLGGLLIAAVSGVALFAADTTALITSKVFWIKLGAIAVAALNALAFRRLFGSATSPTDAAARGMAILSIALWSGILVAGRMIAYV